MHFNVARTDTRRFVDLTCDVLRIRVVTDLLELAQPGVVIWANLFESNEAVIEFLDVISSHVWHDCQLTR